MLIVVVLVAAATRGDDSAPIGRNAETSVVNWTIPEGSAYSWRGPRREAGWFVSLSTIHVNNDGSMVFEVLYRRTGLAPSTLVCPAHETNLEGAYLLVSNWNRIPTSDSYCHRNLGKEWQLSRGETLTLWWEFPPLPNPNATFDFVFFGWGQVDEIYFEPEL